jgi:hypothetical protein
MLNAAETKVTRNMVLDAMVNAHGEPTEQEVAELACGLFTEAYARVIARERAKAGRGVEGAF